MFLPRLFVSSYLSPPRGRRLAALLLCTGAVGVILFGNIELSGAQATAPGQPAPQTTAPANQPATYVGADVCAGCHEDIFNAFKKNPHWIVQTYKPKGWEGKVCESCHGPGSKHAESASAEDIQNPAKMTPEAVENDCFKCHRNQPTAMGPIQSAHYKNQVSCIKCHSIHGPGPLVVRQAEAVNKLCASCHTPVWAQFQRPYRHRLDFGAMTCVDCHNPHGSFLPRMIRTFSANQLGCFKCHGDKRGPFTYEHAPVRMEGCMACHEPHGSANPRMLTRAQVRYVCLECHANLPIPNPSPKAIGVVPPAFHDLRNPRFQNCTICHQRIHGSYVDRFFER